MSLDFYYCEASYWFGFAQAWNVSSNLIFVLAALLLWREPTAQLQRFGLLTIAGMSMLWHGSAHKWALFLDILAIVFWAVLFCLDGLRVYRLPHRYALGICAAAAVLALASAWALRPVLPLLSGAFVPLAVVVMVVAVVCRPLPRRCRYGCLCAGGCLGLAIVLRELDLEVCSAVVFGTHGFWHLLAGVSLFILALCLSWSQRPRHWLR